MTKRVVLIGHPVAHSLSGAMQQAAFDSLGAPTQPALAFAIQRSAKVLRMSASHSGWPLALAISR